MAESNSINKDFILADDLAKSAREDIAQYFGYSRTPIGYDPMCCSLLESAIRKLIDARVAFALGYREEKR